MSGVCTWNRSHMCNGLQGVLQYMQNAGSVELPGVRSGQEHIITVLGYQRTYMTCDEKGKECLM